jgi:4-alpha-glucanotransferase
MSRKSGVLLHITSLPSPYGIGDLGSEAYRFAHFLSAAGQSYWQVLPLNPTDPFWGNTPYSSCSAFAGNTLLISPDLLVRDGLISKEELEDRPRFHDGIADYPAAAAYREKLFLRACEAFDRKAGEDDDFQNFCRGNSCWLDDYALFRALKAHFAGKAWSKWPLCFRDRDESALKEARDRLHDVIKREKILQYLFSTQWQALKNYYRHLNIRIIGDIPYYVGHDSADVWAHQKLFKLNAVRQPAFVGGVPPDYFSKTGQLWGNPVYDWEMLAQTRYEWWINRLKHLLKYFDMIRVDHFRGFVSYWEVSGRAKTAGKGKWVPVPVHDFMKTLLKEISRSALIAEDLGFITADVREVLRRYKLSGMRILLFAFGDSLSESADLPHNHIRDCLVYTGTHDNNTVRGWFDKEASKEDRKRFFTYIGRRVPAQKVSMEFVRMCLMSVADTAIIPMQDILGLGEEARMNLPSTTKGNWQWRLLPGQATPALAQKVRRMTASYGRL